MGIKEEIAGINSKVSEKIKPKEFSIKFKKLNDDAKIPEKNNLSDAGLDFFASDKKILFPFGRKLIPTGISWQPEGFNHDTTIVYMKMEGRSGNALKKGFGVLGGVIVQSYRGEIKVILQNNSWWFKRVKVGNKIAQGIIYNLPKYDIKIAEELNETERADKGFGSSDKVKV